MTVRRLRVSTLAFALLAAAGCGQAPTSATAAPSPLAAQPAGDANLVAAQIADTLQACSYDGTPVRFGMGGQAPRDCRDMIAQVMAFTGLPQNFDVTEADVPNAAAAILLDAQKLPHRVIAFNPQFIELVRRETGGNPWSAVSIMAHEAGHHLAGHTIQPGGSQPPIELEADKFSGFVLYKMGAPLKDAQNAIATLIPEADGQTHPGRRKRLAAIASGWIEACELQGGGAQCQGGKPVATAQAPVAPAPTAKPATQPAMAPVMAAPAAPAPVAATATAQVLPKADTSALPSKGGQFIYDEFGVLDPAIRAQFEKQMYEHAQATGVEIVTLLVKDLGGKSAEDYAHAMMRQLRVGKLDVGNGAVLVVAPEQNQAAAVLGAGVRLDMGSHDKAAQLERWIKTAWPLCKKKSACGGWTENLMLAADHIRRDTRHSDWTIAYNTLGDIQKADAAENGKAVPPQDSKVWRKIVRLSGTVESLNPPPGNKAAWVNDVKVKNGQKAVLMRSSEGLTAMLYIDPRTESLMPGGKMEQGKTYTVIARASGLSWNPKDTQSLDLLSYSVAE